jgi:hypothetical protein
MRNADLLSRIPPRQPDRTEEHTKSIAMIGLDVAKELKELGKEVEGIDLWTTLQSRIDAETPEKYLSDGLHLTSEVSLLHHEMSRINIQHLMDCRDIRWSLSR